MMSSSVKKIEGQRTVNPSPRHQDQSVQMGIINSAEVSSVIKDNGDQTGVLSAVDKAGALSQVIPATHADR